LVKKLNFFYYKQKIQLKIISSKKKNYSPEQKIYSFFEMHGQTYFFAFCARMEKKKKKIRHKKTEFLP